MSSPAEFGGATRNRRWMLSTAIVLLFVVAIPGGVGAFSIPTPVAPQATHGPIPTAPFSAPSSFGHPPALHLASRPASPSPSSAIQNLSYFANTSLRNASQPWCSYFTSSFHDCEPQSASPSALHLKNGVIGVAYAVLTNVSTVTGKCANLNNSAQNDTLIRVGWSTSSNNASSFGALRLIGNTTCDYLNDLEPSFAVGQNGSIYGTFVQANATPLAFNSPSWQSPVVNYSVRNDTLALVTSFDNGTTWSNISVVPGIHYNIARPAIAVYGQTVYIVYENISNTTTGATVTTSQGWSSAPISIQMVYSTNGGSTWSAPYTLPGVNSAAYYTAMSPSIAVNATGTVAVAYATNHHCIAWCTAASYAVYGSDIYAATSTLNGTSWSLHLVAKDFGNGESVNYQAHYFYTFFGAPGELFQSSPSTSVAFNAAGTSLYVAWAGAANDSYPNCPYTYCSLDEWQNAEVYSAASSNGGTSWTNSTVGLPLFSSSNTYYQTAWNPAVGVSPGGTVYVTYSYYNETYSSSCGVSTGGLSPGVSQWIAQGPDGVHWSSLTPVAFRPYSYSYPVYLGWSASVTFTDAGSPVAAFAFAQGWSYHYPYDNDSGTVMVAHAYSGSYSVLTIDEVGLTSGTSWSVTIGGATFTSTASNLSVGIPSGVAISLSSTGFSVGYRTMMVPEFPAGRSVTLTANGSRTINFTTYYGLSFDIDPHNAQYFDLYLRNISLALNYYFYWDDYGGVYSTYGCPFPWYVPAGMRISAQANNYQDALYWYTYGGGVHFWNGTGAGSYTGPGVATNMTALSPFNETLWAQAYGTYDVQVNAVGVPATSTFSFDFDGSPYSASGTSPVLVHNVSTGVHWVTAASATSSTAGWKYIGTLPSNGEVAVPDEPIVNLTFAYVDVGGSLGTVSFHAQGLTNGTVWHFGFNGTEYSSTTPWINLTTHSGTYAEAAYPVVAANGSATYAPLGLSPTVNVTVGSTYTVSFVPAFELRVLASAGGHVAPSTPSYWVAPGTVKNLSATPSVGYRFVGWAGSGSGSYTGTRVNASVTVDGPVLETANFQPLVGNRFNLTFSDGGSLPNGTWWSVYLNGVGYSTNASMLTVPNVYSCTFSGSLGRYTLQVPFAFNNSSKLARYVPGAYPGTVCGDSVVALTFAPEYLLTLESTPGGSATATSGLAASSTALWVSPSDSITLQATPATGYDFLGWNGTGGGSYTGTTNPQTIALSGPASEIAAFAPIYIPPPPRYWLSFHLAAPLPSGTVWTVAVGSTTYGSSSAYLNVTGLLGGQSYAIAVATAYSSDGLSRFTPVAPPTKVTLTANQTEPLAYRTAYWVEIRVVGPGAASPSSGWVSAGTTITLSENATLPYIFGGWTGTGAGSYTGADASHALSVGGPIREVATFIAPPPAVQQITSSWNNPTLWAGLAVAGAVVGLGVGILLARMRRRAPPAAGGVP